MTDNLDYGQLLRNNGDVVSRLLFKIPTRGNSDEELRGFCVLGSGLRPKVTGGGEEGEGVGGGGGRGSGGGEEGEGVGWGGVTL